MTDKKWFLNSIFNSANQELSSRNSHEVNQDILSSLSKNLEKNLIVST